MDGKILTAGISNRNIIQNIFLQGISLPKEEMVFHSDLIYDIEKKALTIEAGEIKYDVISTTLNGTCQLAGKRVMDIRFDATSKNLEILSFIIKPELLRQDPNVLKNGNMFVNGKIFGELKTEPLQYDISFGMKGLDLHLPKIAGDFHNIGFDGKYSSGKMSDLPGAKLEIKNLRGKVREDFSRGNFNLKF